MRFKLGATVITPAALRALTTDDILSAIDRHVTGDWGDLSPEDREANEQAVGHGLRILSAYTACTGIPFWVVTEAHRNVTTVLLPEDY